MLLQCTLVLFVSASGLYCDDASNETQSVYSTDGTLEETPAVTEESATPEAAAVAGVNITQPNGLHLQASTASPLRVARKGRRRPRGFYNDFRYRNRANNPYNPNSPYAFRGRPGQPPLQSRGYYDPRYATGYETQYYDPYSQTYYAYPGYAQPGYYGYPYQPQPQPQPPLPPVPPTPPPTEKIPDLYYVQKADTPDGQYQYKKISVFQDNYGAYEKRRARRMRATKWPQQPQGYAQPPQDYGQAPQGYNQSPQGYYGYPYDPYNRRPPPPPQQYYNQPPYQYPQQPQQPSAYQQQHPPWLQYYMYPKAAGSPRSRQRTGRPPVRPSQAFWSLTSTAAATIDMTNPPQAQEPVLPMEHATEASGD